jgi:glycosyltransferase involved in cell wall biosynthesis
LTIFVNFLKGEIFMISIVMPVYNTQEDWLKNAINSVLGQTYKDFEFFIINDQSTEKHVEKVINEYTDDPRVVILNTKREQKGISRACNLAIKKAKGEWIARMDSDDEWLPQKLEYQINFLNTVNPAADILVSDAYIFDMEGKVISEARTDPAFNFRKRFAAINDATLWRKSIFTEKGIWFRKEYDGAEDYDFYMRCFLDKRIIWLKHPVCVMKTRLLGNRHDRDFLLKRGNIAHKVWKESGLPPYMSFIKPENHKEFFENLLLSHNTSFEFIENASEAKGDYIINTGLKSMPDRISTLINLLEENPQLAAAGSFVKKGNKAMTFLTSSDQIELALLRGHCPVEEQSLVYRNYKTISSISQPFFQQLVELCNQGQVINYAKVLVDGGENYSIDTDKHIEIKNYAVDNLKVINVIITDVRSKTGYSGIDRYVETLSRYCPPHIRFFNLRFNSSLENEFKIVNGKNTMDVYYNSQLYNLSDTYDLVWSALKGKFSNSSKLIIHSNCFDLYTFQKYLRDKIKCKLLFTMHTAPYRETSRSSFENYKKLEQAYEDKTKDFNEPAEIYEALRVPDKIITVIDDAVDYLKRIDADTLNIPTVLIRNGSESFADKTNIQELRNVKDEDLNPLRILFVGHSSPRKGIDQILQIVKKTPNVELHWAGAADPNIIAKAKEENISLISYGTLATEPLKQLYKKCHVLVSGANFEMCSYAFLEAMSVGMPSIAPDVYGIKITVADTGILVPAPYGIIDQEAFKEGLKKFQNSEFYKEKSDLALKRFELFKADRMAKETFEVYEGFFK